VFVIGVCDKGEAVLEFKSLVSTEGLDHFRFELVKNVSCKLFENTEFDVLINEDNLLSPFS
jgi:hypothetical protein